ncbi:MAG: helix-turn-helix domain containing protein, partial [bacterium]|nr:helix-turn-helix domain containing protein [bacterium]
MTRTMPPPRTPRATSVRAPQQQRARAKVARILAAAETAFSTRGYAHTTIARIARQARVSVGTVYAYFIDKDDVLKQLLTQHVEMLLQPAEAFLAQLPRTADMAGTLATLLHDSLRTHAAHAGLHTVFTEPIMQDAKLRQLADVFRERGLQLGRILLARFGGARATADLEASAHVLVGLLEFCTHIGTLYSS